jgi:transporter family-2 protein
LWLLALPMVAGVFVAVQQAINGHVGRASRSALTAALTNFTVGTLVLVLAWLVSLLVRDAPTTLPDNPVLYLGGRAATVTRHSGRNRAGAGRRRHRRDGRATAQRQGLEQ